MWTLVGQGSGPRYVFYDLDARKRQACVVMVDFSVFGLLIPLQDCCVACSNRGRERCNDPGVSRYSVNIGVAKPVSCCGFWLVIGTENRGLFCRTLRILATLLQPQPALQTNCQAFCGTPMDSELSFLWAVEIKPVFRIQSGGDDPAGGCWSRPCIYYPGMKAGSRPNYFFFL